VNEAAHPDATLGIAGLSTSLYVLFAVVGFFVIVLAARGVRAITRAPPGWGGSRGAAGGGAVDGGSGAGLGGAILAQIGLTLILAGVISAVVFGLGAGVHAPELMTHIGRRADWPVRGLSALVGAILIGVVRPGGDVGGSRRVRAHFWWTGAELGVAFGVLTLLSALHPVAKNEPFRWGREIVHFGALLAGVPFMLACLAAVLPVVLDAFEGRSFSSFVGARHVRATKSGFLTVISVLSMAGVAVSSCALCSVTSIMGGFGHDLKRKLLANNGHVVVDVTRPGGFGDWQKKLELTRGALARAGGGAATPVVGGEAMASSASNTAGALVRGIDPDTIGDVIDLKDNILYGRFAYFLAPTMLLDLPPDEIVGGSSAGEPYVHGPDFRNGPDTDPSLREFLKSNEKVYPGVIIGKELARSLHVLVGDEISLLSPMGELGPMGMMPRSRKYRVAAVFYSGMYEYDATHAYVMLADAQSFFGMNADGTATTVDGGHITQIDVRVPDPERVDPYGTAIAAALGGEDPNAAKGGVLRVRDWTEMNKGLFSALKLEKLATFVILSIAILVASFCIVCTLLLMVTEKGKEIAILKALGASDGAIMRIFMLEGMIIGGIGTAFGVSTALATCTGLSLFGIRLDPEVYYITRLPVNVSPFDYAMVALAAMLICTVSTIYPAFAASELRPVDGLRWE
jgi:lipoprotein-releasing system permease protein